MIFAFFVLHALPRFTLLALNRKIIVTTMGTQTELDAHHILSLRQRSYI